MIVARAFRLTVVRLAGAAMKARVLCALASCMWMAAPASAEAPHAPPSLPALVQERTGARVMWSPDGDPRSGAARDSVARLLQGELTADDAVRVALLNNRALQAEFEEIGISRADYRQALLPENPTLDAEIRFGSGASNPAELAVMQELTSILLIPARRRSADAALRRATLLAADAAVQLAADTRVAFYRLQGAEQIMAFWDTTVAAARAAAELARSQHDAGNITNLDLENAQALDEQAQVERTKSRNEVAEARGALDLVMGTSGADAGWRIEHGLDTALPPDSGLADLAPTAIERRLDLSAAAAETDALDAAISLSRFSAFPALRAGVHIEREPEGFQTVGPAVSIAIPLFDRGQHGVERTRARLRQAEDRRAALTSSIRSEILVRSDRLRAARQLAEYMRTTLLPRRHRVVEETQLEFNGMQVGVYQLLQARQQEVGARRDYIMAVRDYWVARAEFERAAGGPLPIPATGADE